MRPVTIAAPLLALAMLTGVLTAPASAAVVPRDGLWGGLVDRVACEPDGCKPAVDMGRFKLRRKEVSGVQYSVIMTCLNRESGDAYDRSFTGGAAFPDGQRIGRRLTLTATYAESSDLRDAEVRTTLDFRGRRAKLLVLVKIDGEAERCTGNVEIPLRLGERARAPS